MVRFLALFVLLFLSFALMSQRAPLGRIGLQTDGSFLLASGWQIKPAGRQIPLSTFPMASVLSRDRRWVVILQGGYLKPSLSVHNAKTLEEVSRTEVPDGWLGLAFAPNSNLLYVSGGSQSSIYEFALQDDGRLEARRTFPVVPAEKRKHTDFLGDLAIAPDGRSILVAALFRNSIFTINPQSGMVTEEFKTGLRPYRILYHPDGKSYFVTSWADGSLYHHNAISGEQIARLPLSPALMDMVWRDKKTVNEEGEAARFQARLFVSAANSNRVHVLAVGEDKSLRRLESINVAMTPRQPAGMTPSGLALSADQDRLFVVCSDANAVAVADVSLEKTRLMGFVPTGWYPTAARGLEGGRLLVLNGRGQASFPNPRGPDPSRRAAPAHSGLTEVQYVGAIQKGSASLIEPFEDQLDEYSAMVLRNSPYRDELLDTPLTPRTAMAVLKQIEHVVYIVKENRTYDQVLGDLGTGNGDPSLTLFGETVTPNHHKLAREFVLLDNFYVNADVSADGHNWTSAGIAPAYVQRMWPNGYGGRRKHYDYEGGEVAALPPAGYLWTNAAAKQISMRNYGWWATNITPVPKDGPQIRAVRDPVLAACTNMFFRNFDLDYPDTERVKPFLDDLKKFEAEGKMPKLILLKIPNDHTSGTAAGKIAARSAMADNDAAFGTVIEALSRSRFWAKMAVFVLEDDAQNGPDHVDSHRSPAFLLSPFTRGRGIDSTMYNTTSMLRTIELILGLQPMTHFDAAATPMHAAFRQAADMSPYTAEKPRYSLDERNAANSATAARSAKLNLEEADMIDDDEMNEILWLALKGTPPPPPVRSIFSW